MKKLLLYETTKLIHSKHQYSIFVIRLLMSGVYEHRCKELFLFWVVFGFGF